MAQLLQSSAHFALTALPKHKVVRQGEGLPGVASCPSTRRAAAAVPSRRIRSLNIRAEALSMEPQQESQGAIGTLRKSKSRRVPDSLQRRPSQTKEANDAEPAAATLIKTKSRPKQITALPNIHGVAYEEVVLLQGFNWECADTENPVWYRKVTSNVEAIAETGITHVWLPPPSQSVSKEGYLPGRLYNLNSGYGTKTELVTLLNALKERGVVGVADVVINHRCADEQDSNGVWNIYSDDEDHEGRRINWGKWAITSDDPIFAGQGNPDTGDNYEAAPDLDHANPELREALKDWLNWLKTDIGFGGWRFDFVRGYAPSFIKEYVDATFGYGDNPIFCVGELWNDARYGPDGLEYDQDPARQVLCNWIDAQEGRSAAFDFTTKGILQEAVGNTEYWRLADKNKQPPGLFGFWPTRAVSFIDNHDTGLPQNHWPFPNKKLGVGYAYILTHPGIPCIYWDHLFEKKNLGEQIVALTHVRKRAEIRADSKVEIHLAEADVYIATINENVRVKLGPRFDIGSRVPTEDDGWELVVAGEDYAVWEKMSDEEYAEWQLEQLTKRLDPNDSDYEAKKREILEMKFKAPSVRGGTPDPA